MPRLRKGRIAILIVFVIVAVLFLLYVYRSGRLVSFGFWVAVSQFVLLILGVATALFNEWVQKNKSLTLIIFIVVGFGALYLSIKQADQSAAETKESDAARQRQQQELAGKLDRIEQSVLQANPDKSQIIAEIKDAREAMMLPSSTEGTTTQPAPTSAATPAPPSVAAPSPPAQPTANVLHDQFLNYPAMVKLGPRSFIITPPAGEFPIMVEAQLAFHFAPNGLNERELIIYVPATGETPYVVQNLIGVAQRWADEIYEREAPNSTVVNLAKGSVRRVVIFHVGSVSHMRAEALEKQGHKLIGERVNSERP